MENEEAARYAEIIARKMLCKVESAPPRGVPGYRSKWIVEDARKIFTPPPHVIKGARDEKRQRRPPVIAFPTRMRISEDSLSPFLILLEEVASKATTGVAPASALSPAARLLCFSSAAAGFRVPPGDVNISSDDVF